VNAKVVNEKDGFAEAGNAGEDFINSDDKKCVTKRGALWVPVGLNLGGREVISKSNLKCAIASVTFYKTWEEAS